MSMLKQADTLKKSWDIIMMNETACAVALVLLFQ
jgi:ribosome-associated toxin RatA of RatAB toxin-antitoxin module